jgi:hypothetical protein
MDGEKRSDPGGAPYRGGCDLSSGADVRDAVAEVDLELESRSGEPLRGSALEAVSARRQAPSGRARSKRHCPPSAPADPAVGRNRMLPSRRAERDRAGSHPRRAPATTSTTFPTMRVVALMPNREPRRGWLQCFLSRDAMLRRVARVSNGATDPCGCLSDGPNPTNEAVRVCPSNGYRRGAFSMSLEVKTLAGRVSHTNQQQVTFGHMHQGHGRIQTVNGSSSA